MKEIDELDIHFFYDLMESEDSPQQEEVYLSQIW